MNNKENCIDAVLVLITFVIIVMCSFDVGRSITEKRMQRKIYKSPAWVKAVIAEEKAKEQLQELEKDTESKENGG